MRTSIIRTRPHGWLLACVLTVSIHLLAVGTSVAEEDHLEGYTIKDLNHVAPPANPYTLNNQFGSESCELIKPLYFLVQSDKNAGDDPRGGPAGEFVCYKAKCSDSLFTTTDRETQFGLHSLQAKKAKLVCLPVGSPCPAIGPATCLAVASTNACFDCCGAHPACASACSAAIQASCFDVPANENCTAAVNTAGCAAECCP